MRISEKIMSRIQKYLRTLFLLFAWILLLGIVTQVSLAGLAFFVDGTLWQTHRTVVKVIEFVPSFMFILGLAGRIPKMYTTTSFLLFFLINFQYYTTYGWLGAIHSVFSLFLFSISLFVAWGSYKVVVKGKKELIDDGSSNKFSTGGHRDGSIGF
ncbi:hypothetical protein A8F94_18590 [Bacillus sp. FJAT-27225]|uniref:DUF6220 domain-containing protein n=1 Tax=Bacillus sp. FJAT-27225 TaxID=1743144 RepID=UPI00080C2CF7|nr:DUF6220 domain-containing protein [Bacillus sp. FJAT-27225]OCA83136.1 hypothetical protein A8F94_18590 [Bacillus sp. FJAT-27225]